jgi:hypothetical protein
MALRGVQGKEFPKYSLKVFSIWRELISKQKIIQNLDFLTGTGNFSIFHWKSILFLLKPTESEAISFLQT